MMKTAAWMLAGVLIAASAVHADVLLLDAIETAPANSASGVERPRSGASMTTVEAQFGTPGEIKPAVGEPPITRWVYPGYTVYFEHDRVIEVVLHR